MEKVYPVDKILENIDDKVLTEDNPPTPIHPHDTQVISPADPPTSTEDNPQVAEMDISPPTSPASEHDKIPVFDPPTPQAKSPITLKKLFPSSKSPLGKRYRTVSKKCTGVVTSSHLLGNIIQLLESQFSCSISFKRLRRRSLVLIRSDFPSPIYNGVKFE